MSVILVPIANFGAIRDIGAAERIDEAFDPPDVIRYRRSARSGQTKGNRLRAVLRTNPIQFGSCPVERFTPCDPLPAGILVAFGTRSHQRIELALLVVNDLWSGEPFHAQRLTGGVFRKRLLANETSLTRDHDRTAPRLAQCAKSRRSCF